MIIYLAIIVTVAVLIVAGLEKFSKYPTESTVYNNSASVQSVKKIIIHAKPEQVWAVMTNVNAWQTWESDNQSPVLHGAFEAGNFFTWKSNGLSIRSNIKVAQPYHRIVWSGPAFGTFAIHTWTITPLPDGSTQVVIEESMEGWLVRIFKGTFQNGLDKSLDKWLADLKATSEA